MSLELIPDKKEQTDEDKEMKQTDKIRKMLIIPEVVFVVSVDTPGCGEYHPYEAHTSMEVAIKRGQILAEDHDDPTNRFTFRIDEISLYEEETAPQD